MTTPIVRSLDKAFDLLDQIIADGGERPLADLALAVGLPFSTAHRMARTLEERDLLMRHAPGRYLPGPALIALAGRIDPHRVLAQTCRPVMARLARQTGRTIHLGVLEDGMVTYLAKAGEDPAAAFTREGMQLEAYCSGIGKVLLAHAAPAVRQAYLADGPFVALTGATLIDPAALRDHLAAVLERGWALDDAEVFETLRCVAVPLRGQDGRVTAALSISGPAHLMDDRRQARLLDLLRAAAARIEARMKPET